MSDRKIHMGLGATLNLGDFNSLRIDHFEEVVVPDGADVDAARDDLYDRVEAYVNAKIAEARAEMQ